MDVIYSDIHEKHAPPHQFNVDRMGAYSESPERAQRILDALAPHHTILPPTEFDRTLLERIHSPAYLAFLEQAYPAWSARGGTPDGLIPYTFASRSLSYIPEDPVYKAGYYCFDPQTPIVSGTFEAAVSSAHIALTAAARVREGVRQVYGLCRPPGHHASRDLYGGYCYLNNAALCASALDGRVAIIDIDYHHGNGTQAIFYEHENPLFVSLHASPDRAYPFFSGHPAETGTGKGLGATVNYALPEKVTDDDYLSVIETAQERIQSHNPDALVVSAGFDVYEDDPLGDFNISTDGIYRIGQALRDLRIPTVVVQEGGYNTDRLGECARTFLAGLESS